MYLLRAQPALLDLPAETLADWLQSEDKDKRLGAVRAAALDPKLAHFHTHLLSERLGDDDPEIRCPLSERLGDDDPEIRDTAQGLFETHPGLLDSSSIAWGLLSPDSDYRQRILNLVHPLDTSNLWALMPLLEACHRNNERCDELRLAAHLTGGGGSEWEDLLRWLGRPKPEEVESCLKEIRNDDQAARHTLKMFANTWEATSGFPNTRKELADRIRSLVDNRRGKWNAADKPRLEKLSTQLRAAGFPTGDIDQAIARIEAFDWLALFGRIIVIHALFWALLILLYPRLPMVQALFFWNSWVRRIAGFGYVGLLLAWIP